MGTEQASRGVLLVCVGRGAWRRARQASRAGAGLVMGAQDAEGGVGRRRAGRGTERGGVEHLQGRVEGGLPRALPAKPQALSA
jgi:hypothetical protein